MNSLVQYGSSDEEDDDDENKPHLSEDSVLVSLPETEPVAQHDAPGIAAPNHAPSLAKPMMGPSKDTNGSVPYAEYEEDNVINENRPQMTERDMLRFLTQPTHPMESMPPSPPGSPNPEISRKFSRFLELKAKGLHFNEDLAKKNAFKNPSLLATMMERAGVEGDAPYLSTLPKDVLDTTSFPSFAYKEELNRSQQYFRNKDAAEKQALSAAGKRTIDFTSAGSTEVSSRGSTPGSFSKRKKV